MSQRRWFWLPAGVMALLLTATVMLIQPDIPAEVLKQRYATLQSAFVTIQGMSVHYMDEGPRSDTVPFVLLHGTSSSLFTWNATTSIWSQKHRVLRIDLPGFGITGPHLAHDYRIESYVQFLHQFLVSRKIERCHLVGNSLGGLIAWNFAVAYPEKVDKLILIDAAGFKVSHVKGSLGFTLARIPVINNILIWVTPRALVRKSVEDVYGNASLVSDELVDQYYDMACREGNRKALIKRLNLNQHIDTALLKKIKAPTLIIWGDQDRLIPIEHAFKFKQHLLQSQVVVLPAVGHVPMEENPKEVAEEVHQFIKKQSGGR